ncbi:hypothetical protein TspCOW1_18690 [Thiohalobacter sp. COW1]|uniref:Zinc finger/thioredoxin putative domain-containing protein n=1 Tax=Thiohalobacter thiocyanaticus TaxID=585455 RepID=A0A1Z4VNX9_9GAMM|nr:MULTISPECIES: zinc-ribbon and DUF3426 domain-containing protein [Thiohalobacter]BAZ93205.1 uncharacterized protein FOKN1_0803 [Thiohalobacter thiocyanaticus]BCO31766.1 hypothetical protein TspCOW1_18690 [Thiohalobacter sp. COW1]
MLTRCPHCQTVFALRAGHLAVASGWVRCPECGRGFNALESLFDSWEDALAPAERRHEVLVLCNIRPLTAGWGVFAPRVEASTAAGATEEPRQRPDTVEIPAVLLEDFQAPRPRTGLRLLQGLFLLLLLLTLLGQGVYLQRERLYTLSEWQPWLERFCAYTGCELPLRRAPDQWAIQQRQIQAHPHREGALEVELDLVNQADFTQAWPRVGIFFTDLTGRRQAGRWFGPEDYLSPASSTVIPGVPAGERLQLRLTLADPGTELVSYQFDFR